MRKNMKGKPNNWCVVQCQLDPRRAEIFYRMQRAARMNVSDTMRALLNPILDRYELETIEAEREAARKVLGVTE